MSDDACYCDYDAPRWYRSKIVKARKVHKCYECQCRIKPGERYERAVGMHDSVYSCATCERCLALREYVKAHVPCFCWAHGSIHEDAIETAQHYSHEAPGLLFGAYRRKIFADRAASESRR